MLPTAKCSELQTPDETAAAAATVRSENSHSITMAALYLLVESEIFVGSLTTIIWAAADRLVNPIHFQYTAANKTDSNELGAFFFVSFQSGHHLHLRHRRWINYLQERLPLCRR